MPAGYAPGRSVPKRYPRQYLGILRGASRRYGIPARVLAAQEFKESSYLRSVIAGIRRSSTGAFGISQFMPGTARGYGVRPGTSKRAVKSQVFGHAKYLHDLGYSKDPRRAIASYAGGPGNPQYGYAAGVLSLARSYRGIGKGTGVPGRGGGRGGTPGTPSTSTRSSQGVGGSALAELTAKALQRQQGPPSYTLPAPPVHTAHVVLPEGQAANTPQSGLVTPQTTAPSVAELLAAARADSNVADAKTTVNPGTPGTRGTGGGGGVARGGQTNARNGVPVARLKSTGPAHPTSGLAGYPARDYFAPAGSAAVAPVSGKVFKLSGSDPRGGPPNGPHGPFGWSVYIRGQNGKLYYLTHMGSRSVKVGQRVKQGQQIGTVGDYARWGGANHIHQGVHG